MIRFSQQYTKLNKEIFTMIRKPGKYYQVGSQHIIKTPARDFSACIIASEHISKKDITEGLARFDADCARIGLITRLEKWYGKVYDDFVLLVLLKGG